jgi:nitrous oxidase accessory protein NosD
MGKCIALICVAVLAALWFGAGNASAAGPVLIVDNDGYASPPDNCGALTPAPTSIEAAVEAAPPGATINVCPGTYIEQVSFEPDDNGTTIRSIVRRAAVIKAPLTIVTNIVDEQAIVHVNGATGIRILAFTITGPSPTPCNGIHYGVWVENNGSGTIDDNHITDIRDEDPASLDPPLSGCQNGVGIHVGRKYFDGPTVGAATITRNLIDRYQKNGMTVDNVGSSATIIGNRVKGWGPTPAIAQNGIQISRGAYGNVRNNEVSDNIYTGPAMAVASSAGILLYGAPPADPSPAPGTTVADNYVYRNDDNIPAYGTEFARILNNRVLDSTRFDGIYMGSDTSDNRIEDNFLRNNAEHDCHDDSTGPNSPPAFVANFWINNDGLTENKPGLCRGAHGDDDNDAEDDEDGEDHDHVHHHQGGGDDHGRGDD